MDAFMREAFALARKADPHPNPRVGAVIVKGGEVLGRGFHRGPGRPHAEIEAINDAVRRHGSASLEGSTIYVSLEPCSHELKRTPPCTQAIIRSGIAKVVFAMKDPNPLVDGARILRAAGVKAVGPSDEPEARSLNRRYMAGLSKKPVVTIKMAMSADGKTATRTGDSRWISNAASRLAVHRMRAASDAIIVGAGTILHDDPALTTHGQGKDPYRIVVDGRLSTPFSSAILKKKDGKTFIITSERADPAKALALRRSGAKVVVCGKEHVDLRRLIQALSAMGLKRILIEGGSGLNGSAIEAGIVDRLALFIAPKLIGGADAKPVIGGRGIGKMSEALVLGKPKATWFGSDLLLEFEIRRKR